MAFTIKKNRFIYILRRLLESPFRFLLHKVFILFCKKIAFLPNTPLLKVLIKLTERQLHKNSKNIEELKLSINEFSQDNFINLADLANTIENGMYNCLGYGLVELDTKDAYHKDCIHDYTWPKIHFSKIDFVCSNVRADVKIPWEKSRLQWLLLLVTFYASKKKLKEKKLIILHRFCDWQKENEFLIGVNWCSSMEVAIRSINIITCYRILAPFLNENEKNIFVKSIAQHKIYLKLFPEISDIPGNHFLATEVGLNIINSIEKSTDEYVNDNLKNLFVVVSNQFNEDGMHIEHAPMYHRLCLDMVLLSLLFSTNKHTAIDCLEPISNVLDRGIQALRAVSSTGGKIALFGDNDSGQVFWFGQDARDASIYVNCNDKSNLLNSCNLLSEFLFMAFPFAYENFRKLVCKANLTVPDCIAAYPFHTLETGSFKLITRVGKLGLGERGAHDHDDNLSFWLFDDDDDLIVEMGCAPYTLSIIQRERCVNSSAHNVITPINSERYLLVDGSIFKTVKGAQTASITNKDKQSIKAKIKIDNFVHERTFILCDKQVIIKDVVSKTNEQVDLHLHIKALKSSIIYKDESFLFSSDSDKTYALSFINTGMTSSTIEETKFYPSYGFSEDISIIKTRFCPSFSDFELRISKVEL
jgi:hypothetical protein